MKIQKFQENHCFFSNFQEMRKISIISCNEYYEVFLMILRQDRSEFDEMKKCDKKWKTLKNKENKEKSKGLSDWSI